MNDAGSDREGDDDNAELVEDEPEEVMGTSGDTEHEALEENDEAVRAAKALLTSLHGDPIYAKIEKELQAMAKDEASVAASGNAPLNTAAPSQYSSDASRPDITNENDDNNNNNDNDMVTLNLERASGPQHTAGPWLSLPPPEFTVCVSPLPTDYPGEMSPNLRAIVETPKSLTTAPTDLEEAPLLQEDVGVSRVAGAAENRGEVSPRPPLPTRKATASFPSFPPLPGGLQAVSFGASHAPQEMSGARWSSQGRSGNVGRPYSVVTTYRHQSHPHSFHRSLRVKKERENKASRHGQGNRTMRAAFAFRLWKILR
ncbi:hypothetical protein C4B63_224g35 [Trypanosoma cruzi]|uniref:Uncharacterized protein n=1 Tax=Trypanosoma cruzi TaxID=5693 RepID=A0A2V2UJU0_TRYCR|nr:hypothetical protein C4B63_224g35 [Trypanosoma cruzi]